MGEVSFISKRSLVSGIPTKPGKKFTLSPLDLLMEKHHIKMVYYFATPKDLATGEMTRRLTESLAEVLSYFHKVSGRLMKDEEGKWIIKCNDSGVRIVEARAKGSVETWLENVDEEKEKSLIHWEDMFHIPYFWATFYLKVTEFEEGGLAVGLGSSHLLADPLSTALFIKAWADIAWCGNIHVPPFFQPLPQRILGHKNLDFLPNSYLMNYYKSILESPSPCSRGNTWISHNFVTIALTFTGHMVQACMDLTQSIGLTNGPKLTPFVALAGLLWACISRAQGLPNGLVDMSICLDVRKMLGLDKGFFGNCMVYTHVDGGEISVDDISRATRAIEEAISKVDEEGIEDLIEWLKQNEHHSSPPLLFGNHGDNLVFINLETMDLYSTMFMESYEPIRVSCYVESFANKGKVLMLPSHPSEGSLSRLVMMTLPNDEAKKLCEDAFLARVRIVEARAKRSVETWLENVDEEKEKSFIHWEDRFHIPYFWATFYLKVTEFEEGGLVVGLGSSHLLADPLSAALFIKAWADITCCGNIHNFRPQKPGLPTNSCLVNYYKSILESPSPSSRENTWISHNFVTIALTFTGHMVQTCMDLTQSIGLTNGPNQWALCRSSWPSLGLAQGLPNGVVDMSICLDVRKMLGLDKGFFSNCMVYTRVDGGEISVDDISRATRAIEEAISKVDKVGIEDLIEWLKQNEHHSSPPLLLGDHGDNLVFINLETMDLYSTMFVESYEPIRASCYIESFASKGKVLMLPTHPSEGSLSRLVMMTLSNDEAKKLCKDAFLAHFFLTILMRPKYYS
ncbi:hypothetical protein Cgig2_009859 [Carnegiea gigantea]|uniref:Uncharacterized protein n=1 Tax=Carnegiea gigantea TaxID=171969 RepID=A0A9Q1KMZ5_9CARY|nr:hypothetical protein Cgig2_009859 [Carnegiea gigantea]